MAEVTGNIYTGRLYYASAAGGFGPTLIIGDDHGAPSLAIDADGFGHLLCTTGPNTGVEDVLYLRSANPVVAVGEGAPPAAVPDRRLHAAPNPFEDAIIFRMEGAGASGSTGHGIRIYDVCGRHVRDLLAPPGVAGSGTITWDGRDDRGALVPPGVYFARPAAEDSEGARPLKVVRDGL
jgi:hypothetical protein